MIRTVRGPVFGATSRDTGAGNARDSAFENRTSEERMRRMTSARPFFELK